ncbi:MAG TPA: hypothetical protein VGO37_02010 [Steroidobacteraceae bacterium]|nr:hypothetical protein [Steroidobacteraceae bacterium]
MKQALAALGALVLGLHAAFMAHADIRPEQTHTALAAIEDAKVLVAAGRGQLLLVGSALTTEQAPSENVVVILEYPSVRDMKPGMILILARNGCEPIESCLIARRVSEVGVGGEVQTDPYTTEGLLFGKTKATLLGVVSYAIDLETDRIRDMRAGRAQEPVTLSQALAQEVARPAGTQLDSDFRGVRNRLRERRRKTFFRDAPSWRRGL